MPSQGRVTRPLFSLSPYALVSSKIASGCRDRAVTMARRAVPSIIMAVGFWDGLADVLRELPVLRCTGRVPLSTTGQIGRMWCGAMTSIFWGRN